MGTLNFCSRSSDAAFGIGRSSVQDAIFVAKPQLTMQKSLQVAACSLNTVPGFHIFP